MRKKLGNPIVFLIAAAVLLLSVCPAAAHNVIVFGWAEGDTIHTESKFSGGRMAKDALIEVFDPKGTKLLEGKTDDKGEFSFKIPQPTALEIVLTAGAGHKNQWTIPLNEIETALASISKTKTAFDPPAEPFSVSTTKPDAEPPQPPKANPSGGVKIEEIEAVVSRLLDQKLRPVSDRINRLAMEEHRVDYRDIIGGIGYIVGIIGIVTYLRASKRKSDA